MSNYITEAFKKLNLLEDIEEVTEVGLDASGIEELRSFLDDAAVDPDDEMPMDIFDLEAEAKEDLKKSYEGKVILECSVCHSHVFEDKDNISMDEEGLACQDIECPYCMSNEGYYIIGEVAPFNQEEADKFEAEAEGEEEELDEVDIEGAADDIDDEDIIEESLTEEMKLDGVEELYDNDEIRGVEELEGVDELEGVEELHGPKHEDPINESCDKEELKEAWVVSSDVDGEICTVDSEREAKATIAQLKRDDKKLRKNKEIEYSYELKESLNESIDSDDIDRVWDILEEAGIEINDVDEDYIDCCSDEDAEAACDILNDAGFSCYVEESEDEFRPNSVMFESLKGLKESYKKHCNESIEDVSVTTEDETMTMTTKDDGGVVIETSPKESELEDMGMEDMPIEDSGEEMIVPVSDESSEIIDASVDALDDTDEEEFDILKDEIEEEPEEEFDEFDEFDEESFDNLGESYLKSCYENVNSFKTSSIGRKGNKLFIEGIIGFDSGNKKKTNFVFEAIEAIDGNYKFEGYNKEISRGKKTFKLSGSLNDQKLVCESLNYNYRSKNELNESIRVYGTVKRK